MDTPAVYKGPGLNSNLGDKSEGSAKLPFTDYSHLKPDPTDLIRERIQQRLSTPPIQAKNSNGETNNKSEQDTGIVQKKRENADSIGTQKEISPNRTGLPDHLKAGVENLSGYSLDDVRVHYNSPKPSQLQALAYTQGTDIHVAPGQEKHLPHETWHVIQQMQGRVREKTSYKGVGLNEERALEREADEMVEKVRNANLIIRQKDQEKKGGGDGRTRSEGKRIYGEKRKPRMLNISDPVVQRMMALPQKGQGTHLRTSGDAQKISTFCQQVIQGNNLNDMFRLLENLKQSIKTRRESSQFHKREREKNEKNYLKTRNLDEDEANRLENSHLARIKLEEGLLKDVQKSYNELRPKQEKSPKTDIGEREQSQSNYKNEWESLFTNDDETWTEDKDMIETMKKSQPKPVQPIMTEEEQSKLLDKSSSASKAKNEQEAPMKIEQLKKNIEGHNQEGEKLNKQKFTVSSKKKLGDRKKYYEVLKTQYAQYEEIIKKETTDQEKIKELETIEKSMGEQIKKIRSLFLKTTK
ncbi:MAG: DUF4157 domain-containing protein [Crocosphaera sp.]|nr:DUF4157 domain-containing protein [Crocosphaera sp.]